MKQENEYARNDQGISYLTILKFYLPLALGSMIMMSSTNIINSVFSGVSNPQAALAAFSIGLSYAEMASVATFSGMSMLITLGRDRIYFRSTVFFMLKVTLICTAVVAALAFTPAGEFVALKLGGASPNLLNDIYTVWRWSLLIPVCYCLIAVTRGILITEKKTFYLTVAIVIRLFVMLAVASLLPRLGLRSGAAVGILMVLVGIIVEGVISLIPALKLYRAWPRNPGDEVPIKTYPPTQRSVRRFTAPLIINSLMWGIGRPVLYAGLARMANPEQTIAVYRIAYSFIWIFMMLIQDNIKQITVAFLRGPEANKKRIIRFSVFITAAVVAVILLASFTPLGVWALTAFIGVDRSVALQCLTPILIFSAYPFVQVIQEHFQARLLLKGTTAPLGVAKAINMAAVGIGIFTLAGLAPGIGAAAGALAYTLGMAVEMLTLRFFVRRNSA